MTEKVMEVGGQTLSDFINLNGVSTIFEEMKDASSLEAQKILILFWNALFLENYIVV